MDINFTFFVQLFHFFVAYQILEKLFCKPTLTAIDKEKKSYSDLINHVTIEQHELIKKEAFKHAEWNRIKLFFSQSFPSLAKKKVQPLKKLIAPPSLTPHEEREYQEKIHQLLMQRLRNVV